MEVEDHGPGRVAGGAVDVEQVRALAGGPVGDVPEDLDPVALRARPGVEASGAGEQAKGVVHGQGAGALAGAAGEGRELQGIRRGRASPPQCSARRAAGLSGADAGTTPRAHGAPHLPALPSWSRLADSRGGELPLRRPAPHQPPRRPARVDPPRRRHHRARRRGGGDAAPADGPAAHGPHLRRQPWRPVHRRRRGPLRGRQDARRAPPGRGGSHRPFRRRGDGSDRRARRAHLGGASGRVHPLAGPPHPHLRRAHGARGLRRRPRPAPRARGDPRHPPARPLVPR